MFFTLDGNTLLGGNVVEREDESPVEVAVAIQRSGTNNQ